MKKEEILALFEQFEQAACEVNQVECWSARELQKLLGYSKWENFQNVINKAKEACINVGQDIADHFPDVRKMVVLGSGAERDVDDILLTRYACYAIKQNKIKTMKTKERQGFWRLGRGASGLQVVMLMLVMLMAGVSPAWA